MDVRSTANEATRNLATAMALALAALALGPLGNALGDPPTVTIDSPASGSWLRNDSPQINGTTSDSSDPLSVQLSKDGESPLPLEPVLREGEDWAAQASDLGDGTYTAVAEQAEVGSGERGFSEAAFMIDTVAPSVSLNPLGSVTSDAHPSFSGAVGTAPGDLPTVSVTVTDATEHGDVVAMPSTKTEGHEWIADELASGLVNGHTYTVHVTQMDQAGNRREESASFTVDTTVPDTTSPHVTLSPAAASTGLETFSGTAGTELGDRRQVTVEVFPGSTVVEGETPSIAITVNAGRTWSATVGGLTGGVYTARATQLDAAGNRGVSTSRTFTVTAPVAIVPPAVTAPLASFTWVPANPVIGQSVSLVSNSTDATSPITAFAWDVIGNGPFAVSAPVRTTSFATAGHHVVRLQVTDVVGQSSVVAKTIDVTTKPLTLMQPFPIVRIAGSETSYGAKLKLLTVQAPVAAHVTVTCHGKGCRTKSESRIAAASKTRRGTADLLVFRRFERPLRAGVSVQIRVVKAGQIGKYTSFLIRRHRLPVRADACLRPTSFEPIACPTS